MDLLFLIYFFILGTIFGSFFGVLVDRLPFSKNVLTGRSICEHCKHILSPIDLIPLLSFVLLRRKCKYCKKKLSWYYPTIELTTGILFAFTAYYVSIINYELLFYLYIISSFIVIFFADLKYKIIPNVIVYPAIVVTIIYYLSSMNYQLLTMNHLPSAIGAFAFFLILFIGTKGRGMGFGDVQLSFLLGLLLGFPNIIIALYSAFLTGAVVSIILIITRRFSLKDSVPFGPFLVFGTLIALFWGDTILRWFPYL